MPTGNEWHHLHGFFIENTPALLMRAEECLVHLELIGDDSDAVDALLCTLHSLSTLATDAQVPLTGRFAATLRNRLLHAKCKGHLPRAALGSLRGCLALLAWQIELIDPTTGQLPMDDTEQGELLAQLGSDCGLAPLLTDEGGYCPCPRASANSLRLPEQW